MSEEDAGGLRGGGVEGGVGVGVGVGEEGRETEDGGRRCLELRRYRYGH